jgi:hypothetical protein
MKDISTELIISIIILIITGTTFVWNWNDRRKKRPVIRSIIRQNNNYLNVHIFNNAPYSLKIKKTYMRKFWFIKKLMSIGISSVNNEHHSDNLAKQKLGNLFLSNRDESFKIYLELKEDVSERTFIFNTNSGKVKYTMPKINK